MGYTLVNEDSGESTATPGKTGCLGHNALVVQGYGGSTTNSKNAAKEV